MLSDKRSELTSNTHDTKHFNEYSKIAIGLFLVFLIKRLR